MLLKHPLEQVLQSSGCLLPEVCCRSAQRVGEVSSRRRPLGALDLMGCLYSPLYLLNLLNNFSVEGASGCSCVSSRVCICMKHYAAGFAYCRSFKTFVHVLFLTLLQVTTARKQLKDMSCKRSDFITSAMHFSLYVMANEL